MPAFASVTTDWVVRRPFPIMLIKLAFYAPRYSDARQENTPIMLDSQNNATLVPVNALFYFKQNVDHIMPKKC